MWRGTRVAVARVARLGRLGCRLQANISSTIAGHGRPSTCGSASDNSSFGLGEGKFVRVSEETDSQRCREPLLSQGPFDLVHVARYLHRPLFPFIQELVAPGGLVAYTTFVDGVQRWGKPSNPSHYLSHGELRTVFESYGFETIIDDEWSLPIPDERPMARFLGWKRLSAIAGDVEDWPSVCKTALWAAGVRAAAATQFGLFSDPLSQSLLAEHSQARMAAEAGSTQRLAKFALRTAFVDHWLSSTLMQTGAQQVVVFGSGFDFRPLRLGFGDRVLVVDLDLACVQALKRRVLEGRLDEEIQWHIVDTDLRESDWLTTLLPTGIDVSQPTLFMLEGILMYFEPDVATRLVANIASIASRDSLVLLHLATEAAASQPADPPFRFGCDDVARFLQQVGLSLDRRVDYGDVASCLQPSSNAAFSRRVDRALLAIDKERMSETYFVVANKQEEADDELLEPLFWCETNLSSRDNLDCSALATCFESIVAPGFALGLMQEEIARGTAPAWQLAYGEIVPHTFVEFLRTFDSSNLGGTFVDVGSGTGKAVITAAMFFDFEECIGIELVESLHSLAVQACAAVSSALQDHRGHNFAHRVAFRHSAFQDTDWSHANFVFCNCASWEPQLLADLAKVSMSLAGGSVVVTVHRPLHDTEHTELAHYFNQRCGLEFVRKAWVTMTWSTVVLFVYRRVDARSDVHDVGAKPRSVP